jgi:uncharacterized protein (DUF58 family)
MKIRYNPRMRVFRWLRTTYSNYLTPSGKVLFWMMVLSSGLGLFSFVYKIYMVFIIIFCLFFVSFMYAAIFSWMRPPRLYVTHHPPARSTCGHSVGFRAIVSNPTKKNFFALSLRENNLPPTMRELVPEGSYIGTLPPGERANVELSLEFTKRGHYVLSGLVLETSFPFGLWKGRRAYSDEKSLLVYPRFHPLQGLDIPVGKRYQPGGIALTSNLGESTEFISTREYIEGDNPRNIHWRSSARRGKLVVKEFQEEYFCRIALVLDTYVSPDSPKSRYNSLESAISIAAAIADNLSRQEYIIDIFAAGPNVYYLQAGRSLAFLENILDILACLDHCETPPFEKLEPILLENLSQITTCIMVFLDWDATRERLVRITHSLGTAVKAIIVRDGLPTKDPTPYEDLIGTIARITPEDEKKGVAFL